MYGAVGRLLLKQKRDNGKGSVTVEDHSEVLQEAYIVFSQEQSAQGVTICNPSMACQHEGQNSPQVLHITAVQAAQAMMHALAYWMTHGTQADVLQPLAVQALQMVTGQAPSAPVEGFSDFTAGLYTLDMTAVNDAEQILVAITDALAHHPVVEVQLQAGVYITVAAASSAAADAGYSWIVGPFMETQVDRGRVLQVLKQILGYRKPDLSECLQQ